eukprot:3795446-Prorocentrum_lima.AAC.1
MEEKARWRFVLRASTRPSALQQRVRHLHGQDDPAKKRGHAVWRKITGGAECGALGHWCQR